MRVLFALFATVILLSPVAVLAQGQKTILACPSQQELEQHIRSDGQLVPENCRQIVIVEVDAEVGDLCIIDFGEEDPGIVGRIIEEIEYRQWWVTCDQLSAPN